MRYPLIALVAVVTLGFPFWIRCEIDDTVGPSLATAESAVTSVTVQPDTLILTSGAIGHARCYPRSSTGTLLTSVHCLWRSRDSLVAGITHTAQTATITGGHIGTTWVIASVRTKRDSVRVTVACP